VYELIIPENRIPFPKPEDYDPMNYEIIGKVLRNRKEGLVENSITHPNQVKRILTTHGPLSVVDNIGMNYDYQRLLYKEEKRLFKEHENYKRNCLWFVAHDRRVPEDIQRRKCKKWAWPRDEFYG